jgi:hypothetical protein
LKPSAAGVAGERARMRVRLLATVRAIWVMTETGLAVFVFAGFAIPVPILAWLSRKPPQKNR